MKKNFIWILLVLSVVSAQCASAAEEESAGFFDIKKFMHKDGPANASKKKLKDIPVSAEKKEAVAADKETTAADTELTEDEKKLVQEMVAKAPEDTPVGDTENVKLPESAVAAMQVPKTPALVPKTLVAVPKDPNSLIVRIPRAPSRVNPTPNTSAPKTPSAPGNKK